MDRFVRSLTQPPKGSRKGDNGRLLVVGGSREYHGAPMFSLLAARRFVDLLYFYPAEKDPHLIDAVKRIPEAIVVDGYDSPAIRGKLDCVLYGIGLGDAKPPLPREGGQLVIDGDGLKRVKGNIPKGAILTPHENEFVSLFGISGSERNALSMAKKHKCVILKKGAVDIIADGRTGNAPTCSALRTRGPLLAEPTSGKLETNHMHNQGMTKGGTGDVLAGLVAAFACKNDAFTAAVAGARINGHAGDMLKKRYGYNYCASDLAEALAESYQDLV
jgi:NAD(P)H-hydrate repair Nnr-like enzyme with NAD(P)H-hydrate dehydratase domain